ncbi:vWA domain-containing protein [Paenibacillus sp. YPG26]|uniref:vWA domain-containing protein n=1 Tax=Paenibacillus sp. YPG26 TaxID=2878915 RepID=UPI00203EAEFE|nr:vWA domain-containing protein [Paenibacillus sp. YPG26]USB33631.1 VWA domain-containing protein [Paenibacillus sp. YPG26]
MQRKFNLLLTLFSLIGGVIGFAIGEWLLAELGGRWPNLLIIGLYFGILALSVGLSCLIAEMILPRLNGASWRQRYVGASWKLLVPATLVLLFVVSLALEFVYELNGGGVKQVKDIAMVIDSSGSMQQNDPKNDRYEAAKKLVDKMDGDKRVAVITFSDGANIVQPFVRVNDQAARANVKNAIESIPTTDGGTNIGLALTETMKHITDQSTGGQGTMVILLSDGVSSVDMESTLAEYKSRHVAVNTVGLNLVDSSGSNLLRTIAAQTGGSYSDVSNAGNLSFVFQQIYDNIGDRTLVTERTGPAADSTYYAIVRIAALLIIGVALGIALGLMFDNRYLARSFGIGGAVSGLLAGLILELGLSGHPYSDMLSRLSADVVLAAVITLFAWIVPVKEHHRASGGRLRAGQTGGAGSFAGRPKDTRSKGF